MLTYGQRFTKAGIPWGTERFVYPDQPLAEAGKLANAVDAGAQFAVVNAEEQVGWRGAYPMRILLDELYRRHPNLQVYASIDSRGDRNWRPFQRELLQRSDAALPMIYPLAFRPSAPNGFISRAFADSLDNKAFFGRPIYPSIQTYAGIGADAVRQQIAEVHRRGLPGYNVYTLGHATSPEWAAVEKDAEFWLPAGPSPEAVIKLMRAHAGLAAHLLEFKPNSLQDVVNLAAAWFDTWPTVERE